VAIHAYVLMTHHVHLLTTPADSRNQGQSGVIRGPARMNSDRPRSGPETAL
jgi:hypothetical protein